MADTGLTDYAQAKRKAARRLGVPEEAALPGNDEIHAALREYQRLFQREQLLAEPVQGVLGFDNEIGRNLRADPAHAVAAKRSKTLSSFSCRVCAVNGLMM